METNNQLLQNQFYIDHFCIQLAGQMVVAYGIPRSVHFIIIDNQKRYFITNAFPFMEIENVDDIDKKLKDVVKFNYDQVEKMKNQEEYDDYFDVTINESNLVKKACRKVKRKTNCDWDFHHINNIVNPSIKH